MSDFRDQTSEMKPTDFDFIQIGIASPEQIREWSHGEVTKPETINYRSFKPEKDGLFCEKIFGPVKDWECHCGRYKRIRYRGVVCKHCKVEVTLSRVRRERMGHINLAVPVAHIWFFKSLPSRIGNLLDITVTDLEKILYYACYIVLEPGSTSYKPKQLITIEEYTEIISEEPENFVAMTGAQAVKQMLEDIDIEDLSRELRAHIKVETSQHRKKSLLKKLKVVEAFRQSDNKPSWMILDVIPVLPPDLRPLVPLEGGRFATSDLNDLYRRVINRNNRLKKLMEMKAPEVILRNERRMLQEAVDALFDNSRRTKAVRGRGKRPLKSLSDMLKGKQGRFRQNLLGKRVDYSGRSVIVVGPELKLNQCGIPKVMALELFKPFIIRKLEEKGYVQTVKSAKKLVEKESPEVWEILEEIIKDHPVLLNRAPTLHRLGIQAFEPVLVEGKAIRIHPLVCTAFNADFDGDQMAVHIPLSFEAQLEARVLMMSTNNILLPANGKPVAAPTQDIIMGCYFLTREKRDDGDKTPIRSYISDNEVLLAYHNGYVGLHTPVRLRKDKKIIRTTPGRVIFNQVVPEELGFVNQQMDKSILENLVFEVYRKTGVEKAVQFLDRLKELGFEYATRSGASVGVEDIIIPDEKKKILAETDKEVDKISRQYRDKVITDGERYNRVIDTWTHTSSNIAHQTFEELERSQDGFNPLWMMIDSGARGSRDQIRQLAGMRGLMAKPQKKITGQVGEIIESPIKSNFREGLSVLEYFISTHGARKGLADTALKTADAGYLTRRLVDVTQDVTITINDCGTVRGQDVSALKEGEDVIEPLKDRIVGSVALDDVKDPVTNEVIIKAGEEISLQAASQAEDNGVEKVNIRSVLTCEAKRGLCRKCYGRNLATLNPVEIGEAVGIIAAQSIGEPGTQLTLRTFHIGGTAGRIAVQTEKTAPATGDITLNKVDYVVREKEFEKEGEKPEIREVRIVTGKEGEIHLKGEDRRLWKLMVPYGAELADCLFENKAEKAGTVEFIDFVDGDTYQTIDEGKKRIKVIIGTDGERSIDSKDGTVRIPRIRLLDKKKKLINEYTLPRGAHLRIEDGSTVKSGQTLYWVGKESTVLFRWDPYSTPILTDKSGKIKFVDIIEEVTMREEPDKEGHKVKVVIEDREKAYHPHIQILDKRGRKIGDYAVPTGSHLLVQNGEKVDAGQILVKLSREIYKTRDITGGLPRVAELFEARRPKDPAVITEIDGRVKFGEIVRGNRQLIVDPDKGESREYLIPHGKHLLVHEGDVVKAGDRLSEGPVNPHDILKIKGPNEVQEYLLNEVQEVYRLQGVKIHDKHIGVIVRQMLQKVKITDPGDTMFLEDEHVDKITFQEENEKIAKSGQVPAKAEPLLLGITKASLTTDSFISAASFQETTRVLTEAAVRGSKDNLLGLKENIIIGHLIPAGTGSLKIKEIKFPNLSELEAVEEVDGTEGGDQGEGEPQTEEKTESEGVVV